MMEKIFLLLFLLFSTISLAEENSKTTEELIAEFMKSEQELEQAKVKTTRMQEETNRMQKETKALEKLEETVDELAKTLQVEK